MSAISDRFTILKAQAGDRQALENLLIAVQHPLHRYLLRLAGNAALAEDLLQDVLLIICRKLGWLRDPELLLPWAYRIASRAAFRRLRAERTWREEALDDSSDFAAAPEQAMFDGELLQHIEELSPGSRAVISLHYLEELSLADISDVLELPLGTVKSRLGYGIAQLRRKMRVPA